MSDRPFSIHLGIVWTAQWCFGALLVTRFCTCEIGRAGVNYLEWDFSAQSSRRCPGAGPAHACLIAVICEWDRARLAHYASLMKRGRFSSDQAWNSQVVYPWHFSCVLSGMCGVTCTGGAEKRRTRGRGGRTEGENYAFPLPKVWVVQNQQRCMVTRLEEGRWSGLEQRPTLPARDRCSSIHHSAGARLPGWIGEKRHCAEQLTSLFLPSFVRARPALRLCNVSHSFSHAQITCTSP